MTVSKWFALVLSFGSVACTVQTDLGTTCVLVRKDPNDAKKSIPLLEKEIKANRDFISFGATECEDLVCVRDSSFRRPSNATDDSQATGYCSRPCVPNSTLGCIAADDADNKEGAANKLSCRALLLDETTLAVIKTTDPATFTRYFGGTTSTYFCARSALKADGGT